MFISCQIACAPRFANTCFALSARVVDNAEAGKTRQKAEKGGRLCLKLPGALLHTRANVSVSTPARASRFDLAPVLHDRRGREDSPPHRKVAAAIDRRGARPPGYQNRRALADPRRSPCRVARGVR